MASEIRVKICGLREPEHARVAMDGGADFLGVVFAKSRRQVSLQDAGAIREVAGPRIELFESDARSFAAAIDRAGRPLLVGVFARQTPDEINRIIAAVDLDLVQLSGGEHPSLAGRIARPVIRTVHVGPGTAVDAVRAAVARPPQTVILLDTKSPTGGGSGAPFDWSVAAAVARGRPVMLAGGLVAANVGEAVRQVQPWALDVSSGVETDGRKDAEKIRAFIAAARAAARDAIGNHTGASS